MPTLDPEEPLMHLHHWTYIESIFCEPGPGLSSGDSAMRVLPVCEQPDTDPSSQPHKHTLEPPCVYRAMWQSWSRRASWRRQCEQMEGRVCAQVLVLSPGAAPILPHLENDDKQEVEVGHSVELLVQV